MKKLFATAAVLAMVGSGLAMTSVVQAQNAQPAPPATAQSDHGMMGEGHVRHDEPNEQDDGYLRKDDAEQRSPQS